MLEQISFGQTLHQYVDAIADVFTDRCCISQKLRKSSILGRVRKVDGANANNDIYFYFKSFQYIVHMELMYKLKFLKEGLLLYVKSKNKRLWDLIIWTTYHAFCLYIWF
jgi:hypothetical protein